MKTKILKEGKMAKNIKKRPKVLRPRNPPLGQSQKKVYCRKCANYSNGECTAFENFEMRQTYAEDLSKYLRPASVINKNHDCKWHKEKNKR